MLQQQRGLAQERQQQEEREGDAESQRSGHVTPKQEEQETSLSPQTETSSVQPPGPQSLTDKDD